MESRNSKEKQLNLNGVQKNILEAILNTYIDDICDQQPKEAIRALNAIKQAYKNNFGHSYISSKDQKHFKKLGILDSIEFILKIFNHRFPQNRPSSYPYVGQEEGYSMYRIERSMIKNVDDSGNVELKNSRLIPYYIIVRNNSNDSYIIAKEITGLLGLTGREDNNTPPVEKNDVIQYINELIENALKKQLFLIGEKEKQKRSHTLFHYKHSDKFLEFVAKGKQDKAEEILKQNPDLLFEEFDVTDYSDRRFKKISGLKYAAWAYDIHMLEMIFKYIPEEKKFMAHKQLNELEINGTEYGSHYEFESLISSIKDYLSKYKDLYISSRIRAWIQLVGLAQRNVPAHVAHEYCNPDKIFGQNSQFNESELKRSLNVYSYKEDRIVSWYPLEKDAGLGFDFAVIVNPLKKPDSTTDICNLPVADLPPGTISGSEKWHNLVVSNLEAIEQLAEVRISQYEKMKRDLLIRSERVKAKKPKSNSPLSQLK